MQVDGEFTVLEGSVRAGDVRTGQLAASTTSAYNAFRDLHHILLEGGSIPWEVGRPPYLTPVARISPPVTRCARGVAGALGR